MCRMPLHLLVQTSSSLEAKDRAAPADYAGLLVMSVRHRRGIGSCRERPNYRIRRRSPKQTATTSRPRRPP